MPDLLRARSIQASLGIAYFVLAAVAVARSATFSAAVFGIAMMLGAYFTGRTMLDIHIRREQILRVCGVGSIVLVAGIVADAVGGSHALGWASVVMAYCAGSRLRAAGIGPAA